MHPRANRQACTQTYMLPTQTCRQTRSHWHALSIHTHNRNTCSHATLVCPCRNVLVSRESMCVWVRFLPYYDDKHVKVFQMPREWSAASLPPPPTSEALICPFLSLLKYFKNSSFACSFSFHIWVTDNNYLCFSMDGWVWDISIK